MTCYDACYGIWCDVVYVTASDACVCMLLFVRFFCRYEVRLRVRDMHMLQRILVTSSHVAWRMLHVHVAYRMLHVVCCMMLRVTCYAHQLRVWMVNGGMSDVCMSISHHHRNRSVTDAHGCSCHVMSCHLISSHLMSVTSCHVDVMSCDVISCSL